MKYHTYQHTRQPRYREPTPIPIGKKLIEQFLTQVIICALLIMIIIGVQLLGSAQVENSMDRVKAAIIYSPSLEEITQNTKDVFFLIINSVKREDEKEEIIPVISIDDEVF